MRHRATSRYVVLLLVCALASACATTGLKRVAVANEQFALGLSRVVATADALEASGGLTKAQRDSLSPGIIRLAQGGKALNLAILAADVPTTQAQVIGVLTVLSDLTVTADGLPQNAKLALLVAIEAARAAVLVISTGVTS